MENEKPFDPTSLMNDADVTDRFKTVPVVPDAPVVETKLEEVDPNEEHDRLYLNFVNVGKGRLEPDIPLGDGYWEARNLYHQYLNKQRE